MQSGEPISPDAEAQASDCPFCQRTAISHILKETPNFLFVADFAPLVEGHTLIIPKRHYACYGAVPASLDGELAQLKREVQLFAAQFYAPPVFWEHGVFRQTVFHAHLHCFPFGITSYDLAKGVHNVIVHSQEDIRRWYAEHGPYFYLEDGYKALLFAPEVERYSLIVRDVLWRGMTARNGDRKWRSPEQRHAEGAPLIEALVTRWNLFQQQETGQIDDAGAW